MTGQTLGQYRILEKLGKGGMGEVYRAEDTRLKRKVALKVLPRDLSGSQERLERFQREAETLAALDHPNIVHIYSVEDADGVRFITMQLVEGKPLSALIPKSGMPLEQIFEIAIPLGDALAVAHDKGVIHRDLKPGNIMVDVGGHVKVLDFGLAKLRTEEDRFEFSEDETEPLTAEGSVLGTVPYMSPEQLQGKPADERSDVFSLGVTLYEMATGKRPFGGDSSVSLMSAIMRDRPQDVDDLRKDVPRHLGRIIQHCLEKKPDDRLQTARDVRNELRALKGEVQSDSSGPVRQAPPTKSSLTRWTLFLVGLVVVLAGVLAFAYLRGPSGTDANLEAIAVLPFANMTGEPSQDYLSEGLGAGLISHLSEVSGLRVVSRAEAWSYRGQNLPVTMLAKRLEVEALVDGELQREGERLRAVVTLSDGQTGFVLWSDRFVGNDLFALQKDIANRLTRVLSIPLTFQERRRLASDPTKSLKAYDFYLQAEQFLEALGTPRNAEFAADLFRQAILLDPEFALAYVGLSEALWETYQKTKEPELLVEAEREAERALEIDPDLPAARVAKARILRSTGRYALSIAELRQVLAGHPQPDQAMRELAFGYQQAGDLESAEEYLRAAVALRGDDWHNWQSLGSFLMYAGRYAEARESFERASALTPESITWPQENLATVMILEGDFEEAIEAFERLGTSTRDPFLADNMATAYFFLDRLDEAERLYRLAVELNPTEFRFHGNLGDLHSRRGRDDLALTEYRRAMELADTVLQTSPRNTELRLELAIYAAKAEECPTALGLATELETELPPTAYSAHDLAYVYALCDEGQLALAALERAVERGFRPELIREEDEFQLLWEDPGFQALTAVDPP